MKVFRDAKNLQDKRSVKEKLLKHSDIMSYVNVVNMGHNAETQDIL